MSKGWSGNLSFLPLEEQLELARHSVAGLRQFHGIIGPGGSMSDLQLQLGRDHMVTITAAFGNLDDNGWIRPPQPCDNAEIGKALEAHKVNGVIRHWRKLDDGTWRVTMTNQLHARLRTPAEAELFCHALESAYQATR